MKYFVIEIELKNPYSFGERLIPYYVIYKCNNSFELNQQLSCFYPYFVNF